MNELQIFNNAEFGQIRTIVKNDNVWFVGKDVAEALGYVKSRNALAMHVDEEDKQLIMINHEGTALKQGGASNTVIINESGLYSLVLSSKLPTAKKFKRWVTSEVLPAIHKNGIYMTDSIAQQAMNNPMEFLARAVLVANEQISKLKAENQMQAQQIAEFKPKAEYVDVILQSTGTVTTTQIAADYGLSAKKLNKILHDEKIQHKVNNQWILYKDQMNKGYTKSETIFITRSDGREETKMYMKWTQKGRLKIHEILTNLGFIANFDYEQAKLFE